MIWSVKREPKADGRETQFPLPGPGLAEGEDSPLRRVRSHSEWAAVVGGASLGQGACSPEGIVGDH